MAEVRNPTEPSMEEILASIRRIIIDDDDALPKASADRGEVGTGAAGPAPPRPPGETSPPRVAGTDASVAARSSDFEPQLQSVSSPAQDAILDLSRRTDRRDVTRREPEATLAAPMSPTSTGRLDRPPSVNGTVDAEPRTTGLAASMATLTKLASIGQTGRPPELPLGDLGRTLEDMVRELLRPHMKEWLDAHLPQLVERLVRDEIARLVREAQQH